MWKPKIVERALFRWGKWRQSLITEWGKTTNTLDKLSAEEQTSIINTAVQKLGLPDSKFLKIYWVCCVASDYNLDYPNTYDKIVFPKWLPLPRSKLPKWYLLKVPFGEKLKPGLRIYPPPVIGEKDIDFFVYQDGYSEAKYFRKLYYPKEDDYYVYLPAEHELYSVLNKFKGRPRLKISVGKIPLYSDRLAIKCAVLKDLGTSYVQIAEELGLPISKPYLSEQSDVAKHLVTRGRSLITNELNNSHKNLI